MLGLFGLLRGCGGPWLERGVSTMEEKRGGGERTSHRDRASSLLIVSAYFMMSGWVCRGNGKKCVPDE